MGKRKVIFIVEDDPGFNMMLTKYLISKNKWEIHSFESGEESLKKMNLKPDIFLQDIDLPGINGIEVMNRVKQKLPSTEFIFLSAHNEMNVLIYAIELGGFDYIVKDSYAKENALNKIEQVVKIMDFLAAKQSDRKNNVVLIIVVIVLLLALIVTWVTKN